LPQALHRLVHEFAVAGRTDALSPIAFYRAYPLVLLVMMGTVVSLFSVFVMPKFQQIFKDFGTKLPLITQGMLNVAETLGPLLVFALAVVVLVASGASLWQTLYPTRFGRTIVRGVRDYLAWMTPILHGIEHDRGLADGFDLIADALAAGTPIDRAVTEASRLNVKLLLQRRFVEWEEELSAGGSISESARRSGMPDLVVGLLASARDASGVGDVFAFLARYYHSRFSRTAAILQGASVPVLVFLFGVLVGAIVLSLFAPLISLINAVAGGVYKGGL
jgi:type IV pilus assembly protein PilC